MKGNGEVGGGRRQAGEQSERDSTAVVVGATGAIGQAVIRRLTRRGLPVLAVARGQDRLDELAAAHELVTPCPADIGGNDAIAAIGAALTGTVRIAVFAAGLPVRGSADTIDPDALAVGSNIKVGGLLRLLHAVRDRLVPGSRFVTFAGLARARAARARGRSRRGQRRRVQLDAPDQPALRAARGDDPHAQPGPGRHAAAAPDRGRGGRRTRCRRGGGLAGVRGAELAGPGCPRPTSWPGRWSSCSTRRPTCCTAACSTWTPGAIAAFTEGRAENPLRSVPIVTKGSKGWGTL